MFFINELKKIISDNGNNIAIFVDMDGVVSDYRFGEGINISNNVKGTYLNKRPINTTINNIKKINDELGVDIYILSSCIFPNQADEKKLWLKKYMPFIKEENKIIVISDTSENRKILKINAVREHINKGYAKAIMIDDTHDILFLAIKELKEKVIPFHVISLID